MTQGARQASVVSVGCVRGRGRRHSPPPFSPDSVSAAVPKQPSNALCEADGPLAAGSVRGVRHHRLQGAEGLFNVFCFQKQGIYILRP